MTRWFAPILLCAFALTLAGCGRKAQLASSCEKAVASAKAVYDAEKQKFPLNADQSEMVCDCAAEAAVKAGKSNPKAVEAIDAYWTAFAAKPGVFDEMKIDLEQKFGSDATAQVWTMSMNALMMGPVNVCQGVSL